MLLDLVDYETKARSAVKLFWSSRNKAGTKTWTSGNLDGFIDLVIDIVHANGLTEADIMLKRRLLTLPDHFCPTKSWDLLVMNEGKLIAALKFASQVGASFGKSANNCCEQSLNMAVDLWAAFRQGAFGENRRPFVGHLGIFEDSPASHVPVKDVAPNFPLVPEYRNASFAERYNILCKKLMAENLYTAAAVILSPRSASKSGEYSEMSDMTGLKSFVTTLAGHIAAEAAM
jgi:hypothetical protein